MPTPFAGTTPEGTSQAQPAPEPVMPVATAPQAGPQQDVQQPFPQQQPYAAPGPAPYQQPPVYAAGPAVPVQVSLARTFAGVLWMTIMLGGILALVGTILIRAAESQGVLVAGGALGAVGLFLAGFPMLVSGIYHEEFNERVRTGLLIGGSVALLGIAFF